MDAEKITIPRAKLHEDLTDGFLLFRNFVLRLNQFQLLYCLHFKPAVAFVFPGKNYTENLLYDLENISPKAVFYVLSCLFRYLLFKQKEGQRNNDTKNSRNDFPRFHDKFTGKRIS